MNKLFGIFKKKTEQEAIQDVLNSIHAMEDAMYSEENAQIDREKATTFKAFFSAMMDDCKSNPDKEKAYKDVIMACVLVEKYPSAQNSRILDDKIKIAQKFD